MHEAITPDTAGLKALSHPMRLRLLGLLRLDGPATATALAGRLGLNSGATSYHLRQLADHGFIEDDPERGNGRERWWRAAHDRTHMSAQGHDPQAAIGYLQSVAVLYGDLLARAAQELPFLPPEWDEVVTFSDWEVRVSPATAQRLKAAVIEVMESAADEPDADTVYTLMFGGFPFPGQFPRAEASDEADEEGADEAGAR